MMTTAERPVGRKRVRRPEDCLVEQPPSTYANLTGDALYQALIADKTVWDQAQFAAECMRELHTIYTWTQRADAYAAWVEGAPGAVETQLTDRTPPKPMRYGSAAVWEAGVLRRWMIQVGLMTRAGVGIPHKPTGRPPGAKDSKARPRRSPMTENALQFLEKYNQLRSDGLSRAAAEQKLAEEHDITARQVARRVEMGRTLAKTAGTDS